MATKGEIWSEIIQIFSNNNDQERYKTQQSNISLDLKKVPELPSNQLES